MPDASSKISRRSVDFAPARTPERWEQLKDQIVEALLAWHRQDSRGCVGAVDNTQENFWPSWYRQHVEVLWTTLNQFNNTGLTMLDKRLFRSTGFFYLVRGKLRRYTITRLIFALSETGKAWKRKKIIANTFLSLINPFATRATGEHGWA